MSLWDQPAHPATNLGRHRTIAANAGLHVSPLCLGALNIGDKWQGILGTMDKESSFKLLDAFYKAGGNFIDTACNYQDGTSEMFIGEWMEARGIRDQMVIATKVHTTAFDRVARTLTAGSCSTLRTPCVTVRTSSSTRPGPETT